MADTELSHDALGKAIAALEAQRPVLGSAIVDAALAPLLAQQQASHRSAPPRRRQVSVLFLDVVGSTALSQTIDPEDLLDIMDSALQSFSARVRGARRQGPAVRRRQPARRLRRRRPRARTTPSEPSTPGSTCWPRPACRPRGSSASTARRGFQVRVGIHTGHVLLGGGVDDEGTIRGFTVNIAARLEQTRAAGKPAHQPGHLAPRARRVRRRGAAAAAGQGRTSRCGPSSCARQAARLSRRHARHRRHRDADGRRDGELRAAGAALEATLRSGRCRP